MTSFGFEEFEEFRLSDYRLQIPGKDTRFDSCSREVAQSYSHQIIPGLKSLKGFGFEEFEALRLRSG